MLVSDQTTIRKLQVTRSTHYNTLVSDLHSVIGIAFYAMMKYVYWSDLEVRQISRYVFILNSIKFFLY